MDLLDRYYRYWGKAHPVDISGTPYHLLVYHSLDVAAVGRQILEVDHRLLNQLAAQLSMKPKNVKSLLVWALSLHDIGKFARVFQNLAPDMSDALVSSDKRKSYSLRHDSLGYLIWSEALLRNITRTALVHSAQTILRCMIVWRLSTSSCSQLPAIMANRLFKVRIVQTTFFIAMTLQLYWILLRWFQVCCLWRAMSLRILRSRLR